MGTSPVPSPRSAAGPIAGLIAWATVATAAEPNPAARNSPTEEGEPALLSVSVSGGASLGSFEAGALHYLVERLRDPLGSFEAGALHYLVERLRDRRLAEPVVFSGTSAGAINASSR